MSWDEIYALYCVETGWTWEYVGEEMTMLRAMGFLGIWKTTPPLRAVVTAIAVALGMPAPSDKPKARPGEPRPPGKDIGSYIEAFSGAGISVEKVTHRG